MAISRTSRYQTNQTALFADRNGQAQLGIVHQAPVVATYAVQDYVLRASSRVDSVAALYYGAEDAWWVFGQANPQVLDWTVPVAGAKVMIPSAVA